MRRFFRSLFRIIKGQYLGPLILVFGLGIGLERLFILTTLSVVEKFRGPDPDRLQRVHRLLFAIWLGLFRIGGLMKTLPQKGKPIDGPCIIVANHPGLFDVIVLIRDVPRMSVLARRGLGSSLGLGSMFRLAGYVLAPEYSDTADAVETMKKIEGVLQDGYKFMLFPEGTRSPKNGMLSFKAGAFKIARMADVPIQPVVIYNHPPFLPHEDRWYYPPYETSTIQLEFMDPIPPPKAGEERKKALYIQGLISQKLGLSEPATCSQESV